MRPFRSSCPASGLFLLFSLLTAVLDTRGAQAPQTLQWISPAPGTVLRLNESYPLAATASSGLPVTFERIEGPAVLTNNTIQVTNAGSVLLRARQVGDEQWQSVSEFRLFNPATIQGTEISSILVSERALDIELAGPLAFIANGTQGLIIQDISTPEIPQWIGRVPLPGSAARVAIQGALAYVVSIGLGLQIVDISQPTQPVVRGTLPLEGIRPALKVVGRRAYLGDSQRGLVIVDISDPAQPVERGWIRTPALINGIDVAGERVYVAAGAAGLQIYEVSTPGTPSWLGGLRFSADATDVQVVGSTATVAASVAGLRLVDVSNPSSPKMQATLATQGYASRLQWIGSKVFLAAASGGLQVVDLLLTERRRVAGEIPVQRSALGLKVAGDVAYVLTDHYGVRIFRLREGIRQQLNFTLPSQVSLTNPVVRLNATIDSGMPIAYTLVRGNATLDGQILTGTTFGKVVVRAEQSGDSLFLPVQIETSVTFEREPQTIQFHGPYQVFMTNPTVTLSATASSGLPVVFRRRSGAAELEGAILTATQAGTIVINLYQSGSRVYQNAPPLEVEIQALRSSQQVEFQLTNRIFLETPELPLVATSNVGLPVEFRVLSGPGQINGPTLTVTNPGVVIVRAIQPGNTHYEPAQVDRQILVLSARGNGRSLFDPSLQLDQWLGGTISWIVPLPNGSLIAGAEQTAWFNEYTPYISSAQVVRLDSMGRIDPDFPVLSWGWGPIGGSAVLLGTNELMVSTTRLGVGGLEGPMHGSMLYKTRLDLPHWSVFSSIGNEIRLFSDAKDGVLLAGTTYRTIPGTAGIARYAFLSRLMPDDQWDPRFGIPPGMADRVQGDHRLDFVHAFTDGSVVVAGQMHWPRTWYDVHWANSEAFRLAADGTLLWRYTLDSPKWVTPVKFVAEIPGDRLVLFPSREVLDATTGRRVGRFPIPADVIAATTAYFQEPDGRLILSGTFTNYGGITRRGLAAVLPDGSLDLTFNPGLGTTNGFKAITRESEGGLLLGGDPGTFDGFSHRGLIRLFPRNPDYTPPASTQLQLLPPTHPLHECTEPSELHVIRTGALNETHRVRIQTESGTATPGVDFVPIDTELVFGPGERVKSVSLRILGDQPTESPETFAVRATLEPGLTLIGTNLLNFQINDFVCGVAFEFPSFSAVESAGPAEMRVWTAQNPPYGFTTRIRTRDATAQAGRDYRPYEGSPVATVFVPIEFIDNGTYEGERTFRVEAYDSETGLAIPSSNVLEVTIREDDSLAGPRRGVVGSLASILPAPDGWILQGRFTSVDGLNRPDLASVRFDGSVNPAFAPPPELDGTISLAVPVPGGGMVLAGNFSGIPSLPSPQLIELDAQGQVVPTFRFRTSGGSIECLETTNEVRAAVVLTNGRRFVAGNFPQFYECSSDPRLLELSPDGAVIGSWPVPLHNVSAQFRFVVTSSESWFLQGSSGVCRFTESGLRFLQPVALEYPAVAAALPDGSLAGVPLSYPIRLQTYQTEGSLRAEVRQFEVDGEIWESSQINGMTIRSDGWILLSGLFRSPSVPLGQYLPRTFAVNPATLTTGQPAPVLRMNDIWLTRMTTHPGGAVTGLQLTRGETGPYWWRLDASGAAISDVAFGRIVADAVGQVHFTLSGQAPNGYTIETSDDLVHWTTWFTSKETNWGMAFHTPPLPPELLGRYFRIR